MALSKEQKVKVVTKLKDIIKNSQSIVFVNFHKLSVIDAHAMRRGLRDRHVGYFVAKKTLVRRTLSEEKIEGELPMLDGELALAYGDNPVIPASGIAEFVKKYKNSITILGGIFEGKYKSKEEMTTIASIPPLEVLYGQFVQIINSPIQGLVVALGQIAKAKNHES